MSELLMIDGSGGGGQVLRTALSLSLVTGRAFQIDAIRGLRRKPGLMRQHLCAVKAAAQIGGAQVQGAELGSDRLRFEPGELQPGDYEFNIGSAGSSSLVVQTLLPPILASGAAWSLRVVGGTHNPMAPPAPFLVHSFVPLLRRMGARVELQVERVGFMPAGGGALACRVERGGELRPLEILERGELIEQELGALVARLPRSIAEREVAVMRAALPAAPGPELILDTEDSDCAGNLCWVHLRYAHASAWFSGFGERRRSAERVARACASEALAFIELQVPIEARLCDQLLVPLALAGGGCFRSTAASDHSRSNARVIETFLPIEIRFEAQGEGASVVTLRGRGG